MNQFEGLSYLFAFVVLGFGVILIGLITLVDYIDKRVTEIQHTITELQLLHKYPVLATVQEEPTDATNC